LAVIRQKLPKGIFEKLNCVIGSQFEFLDCSEIAKILNPSAFLALVEANRVSASVYKKSAMIAEFLLSTSVRVSPQERSALLDLYLSNGWAVRITGLIRISEKERLPDLLRFAATHLSNITDNDLMTLQQKDLITIISSDETDGVNEADLIKRFRSLTSSSTYVNKRRNQAIWRCMRSDSNQRAFIGAAKSLADVRCLVLGSALMQELNDVRDTLIASGLSPDNVVVYKGDCGTPECDFLWHFNVVFAFTRYQFDSLSLVSERLSKFVRNRGGSVILADGFMRDDDWGCGDGKFLELMPVTRGAKCQRGLINTSIKTSSKALREAMRLLENSSWSPHRVELQLKDTGVLLASYVDGIPLLAYCDVKESRSRIIALNCLPLSSAVFPDGWSCKAFGTAIFGNLIEFACRISEIE
jgi:hypothetical protein